MGDEVRLIDALPTVKYLDSVEVLASLMGDRQLQGLKDDYARMVATNSHLAAVVGNMFVRNGDVDPDVATAVLTTLRLVAAALARKAVERGVADAEG